MTLSRRAALLAWFPSNGACAVALRAADGSIARVENPSAARSRALPPGSAVKPLLFDSIDPSFTHVCQRRLRIRGRTLDCSHLPQTAPLDGPTALAASCNCWFAAAARRLPPRDLHQSLLRSGAEADLAIDEDSLALQALGLEGVRFTPLALAHAYRRLARSANSTLRDALRRAARDGTAQLAASANLAIAGKTGTSLLSAWFAGFAPVLSPRIIVVVQLNSGRGPTAAAPLAREIFEWWQSSSSR